MGLHPEPDRAFVLVDSANIVLVPSYSFVRVRLKILYPRFAPAHFRHHVAALPACETDPASRGNFVVFAVPRSLRPENSGAANLPVDAITAQVYGFS